MLRSILFNSDPIDLMPQEVELDASLNVFAANSMTLLIGPNGSGKTRLMTGILSALGGGDSLRENVKLEWRDPDDAASTYALYYTPAPYATSEMPRGSHFEALRPRQTREPTHADVETAIQLANDFGMSVSPLLKLQSDIGQTLQRVRSLIFKSMPQGRARFGLHDEWASDLNRVFLELNESRRKIFEVARKAGQPRVWDTEEYKKQERSEKEAEQHLLDALRSAAGDEILLKLRVFHFVYAKQSKTRDMQLTLLQLLGLNPQDTPQRRQRKAEELFHTTLEVLRSIQRCLASSLDSNVYRVTTEQWRELETLQLDGIAELSVSDESSGAAALLEQFSLLKKAITKIQKKSSIKNLLLLIDEGDAFLHLDWQQRYVDFLDKAIEKYWRQHFDSIQVILATHSPVLMSDFPRGYIVQLSGNTVHSANLSNNPEAAYFGAPLQAIVRSASVSGSLGAFSVRVMRDILKRLNAGRPVHRYFVNILDDQLVKKHVEQTLAKMSRK